MRGHQPIIAMRHKGVAPRLVMLDIDPDGLQNWRDWPERTPHIATVQIDPQDRAHLADLRFVVGLTVVVSGSDADRVEDFGAACIDASAERVLTFVHEHHAAGARIVHTTDTKEGVRWPN